MANKKAVQPVVINNTNIIQGGDYTKRKVQQKKWGVALVLAIFFGWLGVDRFYLGHIGVGLLKLFTFGLFGIMWVIDIILIAVKHNFSYVRWEESSK